MAGTSQARPDHRLRACRGKCAVLDRPRVRNRGSSLRLHEPYERGWETNEGALGGPTTLGRYGSELVRNSFLRLAARRRSSWAALERRAERPDCAPSRGLVSESAVHLVSVMSPRSSRARGRGRRWARIAEGRSMVSVRRVRKACWCRPTAKVRPDGAHVKFWRWARVPTEPGLIVRR